jgi:hypothetical protein
MAETCIHRSLLKTKIKRRQCYAAGTFFMKYLSIIALSASLLTGTCTYAQLHQYRPVENDISILKKIDKYRPLKGAAIPADIKNRIGATHVGGKYFFTNEPYLVEGAKKLNELGMGVCKLWFYKNPSGYQYNSKWDLPKDITLAKLAQHPYYKQAFDVPVKTIVLSTSAGYPNDSAGFIQEEKEYYELALYLLTNYRNRDVTFILENWEGDWIVRGGTGWDAQWGRVNPPADVDLRFQKLRQLFTARQQGVNRARATVSNSKCKVYHAIEVNKVIDAMYGVPTVTTQVLPFVETDMVSWSAYDATDFDKTGLDLYKGIDFIKQQMKPTAAMKNKVVFLGEIGIPEMATKNLPQEFRERWDTYMAVCLAQNIPYMIMWELYCNETAKDVKIEQPNATKNNRDLNGFWLVRPDGTTSYVMKYFQELFDHSGKAFGNECNRLE